MGNNKNKSDLLGEVYSSARARLTRMLLFQFVVETNKNVCYQCGKTIENIEDFSIEHKEPWMGAKNPNKSFYDLGNIAYSHLSCNRQSAGTENRARGEYHPNSKLTSVQVYEIKKKLNKKYSLEDLSNEYNVSKRAITKIRDGENWK